MALGPARYLQRMRRLDLDRCFFSKQVMPVNAAMLRQRILTVESLLGSRIHTKEKLAVKLDSILVIFDVIIVPSVF